MLCHIVLNSIGYTWRDLTKRFSWKVISRPNQSYPPLTEILHFKLGFSERSSHDHWKNFQLEEELAWVMDLHWWVISLCVRHTYPAIALMDFLHPGICDNFLARYIWTFSMKAIFSKHNFLDVDTSFQPAEDIWQGKSKSEVKDCCFWFTAAVVCFVQITILAPPRIQLKTI